MSWAGMSEQQISLLILYPHAQGTTFSAWLSQLLFPGLAGSNNHSSRHKAVCQNHQGLFTESGDRIQRTFSHLGPEQKCQVMEM